MKTKILIPLAKALAMLALVSAANAQGHGADVYWHIDPSVKNCSMVIDPSLTQAQWKMFIQQTAPILTYKALASADPLGTMNFNIAIDQGNSPIDQHNLAWINTFTHPDADCPLGDAVSYPALRARMGVTDRMDVGAYWTTAPGANYGMVGADLKYMLSQESEMLPAAAARASLSILTGVSDFDFSEYSVELMASKKVAMFTPYVGLRGSLAVGVETTPKVSLNKESTFFAQGYAGVTCSIWVVSLAAEYNIAEVKTFALAVGFNF